jgi:hypothetical protein
MDATGEAEGVAVAVAAAVALAVAVAAGAAVEEGADTVGAGLPQAATSATTNTARRVARRRLLFLWPSELTTRMMHPPVGWVPPRDLASTLSAGRRR